MYYLFIFLDFFYNAAHLVEAYCKLQNKLTLGYFMNHVVMTQQLGC